MKQKYIDYKERVKNLRKQFKITQEELGYNITWYNKTKTKYQDEAGYVDWEVIDKTYRDEADGIDAYMKKLSPGSQKSIVSKIEQKQLYLDNYLDSLCWFFTRKLTENNTKPDIYKLTLEFPDRSGIIRASDESFDKQTRTLIKYRGASQIVSQPIFPSFFTGESDYINEISYTYATTPKNISDTKLVSNNFTKSFIELINLYGSYNASETFDLLDTSTKHYEINLELIIDLIDKQSQLELQNDLHNIEKNINEEDLPLQVRKGSITKRIPHSKFNKYLNEIFKYSLFKFNDLIDSEL